MLMKASRGFPGCVPLLSGGAHQLRSKVHCPDRVVVCRALFINSRRYENFCLQRYHHVSPITASSQQSSVHDSVADLGMPATRQSSNVFLVACAATCLAALSRTAFSVLALPIFDQYGLPSHLLGRLQATLLTGYLVGQIPAGILADGYGGVGPLALGLLVWCLATAAIGVLLYPSPIFSPFSTLVASHAVFGLAQSILMPGISASAARWFSPSERGSKTSTVYSWYNIGNVVGLAALPILSTSFGWATGYLLVGCIGTAVGLLALWSVAPGSYPSLPRDGHRSTEFLTPLKRAHILFTKHRNELTLLSWTHAVIGLGFFVLQAWVPLYIFSLPSDTSSSSTTFSTVGLLSAIPWLATAITARLAGHLADWLHTSNRWTVLAVRRWMQITSHLGGSLAMLILALISSFQSMTTSLTHPNFALGVLCLAIAMQGLNYAGFHSYVQDVAPRDAGLILAFTNFCSILAGILGNLIMGHVASVPGQRAFGIVFALMAVAYGTSSIAWAWGARGRLIKL